MIQNIFVALVCLGGALAQSPWCCIQPHINGPDQCTTVAHCNEAQSNCLGDCEGIWTIGSNKGPIPSSPPATSAPIPQPMQGSFCCIQPEINGPDQCTTVVFCNEAQSNCLGDCEGLWRRIVSPERSPTPTSVLPPTPTPRPNNNNNRSTFYFGHSLIYHTNTNFPNTNWLGIPYWINQLEQSEKGRAWYGDGQFRIANYNLPPTPQWGFQPDLSIWQGSLSAYDSIVYTDLNFIQYKSPNEPYDNSDMLAATPIDSVVRIIDYVNNPSIPIYIYECWKDAAAIVPNYDPANGATSLPSNAQRDEYFMTTDFASEYHQWWLDLINGVLAQRPNANVQLIPVAPILVSVLRSNYLSSAMFADLFEDNAPHGYPTIYFLAAVIQYTFITGQRPSTYTPPTNNDILLPSVVDNFEGMTNFIFDQIQINGGRESSSFPSPAPTFSFPTSAPTLLPVFSGCFSAKSLVLVKSKGMIPMSQLAIGDEVAISITKGDTIYDTVYSFGHRHPSLSVKFLQLHVIPTKNGTVGTRQILEITHHHMVLMVSHGQHRFVPASMVQIGYDVVLASGTTTGTVVDIRVVRRKGVYAPFTYSGRLIVDDITVSNYVSFQNSDVVMIGDHTILTPLNFYHWLAYVFETPHRMASRAGLCPTETYSVEGLSIWVHRPLLLAAWFHRHTSVPFMIILLVPIIVLWLTLFLIELVFVARVAAFLPFLLAVLIALSGAQYKLKYRICLHRDGANVSSKDVGLSNE